MISCKNMLDRLINLSYNRYYVMVSYAQSTRKFFKFKSTQYE